MPLRARKGKYHNPNNWKIINYTKNQEKKQRSKELKPKIM